MSDTDHPTDDEVVSAYLDGEATPAEVARVETEPALQARLAAFRAVSARVAQVPEVPAEAREAHIRQATAALDSTPAPVHDLDAARRRRRTVLLSAAAVIVVLLLGAGLAPRLLDGEEAELTAEGPAVDDVEVDADQSPAAAEVVPEAAQDRAAGEAPSALSDEFAVEGGPARLPHLGSFATRQELDEELEAILPAQLGLAQPAPGALPFADESPCAGAVADPALRLELETAEVVYVAEADLDGIAVEVLVLRTPATNSIDGLLRRYLVDPATCLMIDDGVATLGS